jgi:sec-independent protein translocase protein TatC
MAKLPDDEQLLEKTKMSFSEHLEELRSAAFKSLAAWVLATLVGLMLGWSVVDYVQTPLRKSLDTYYRGEAEVAQLQRLEQKQAAGENVPEDLETAADELAAEGLVPEELYVDRQELSQALGVEVPGKTDSDYATHRKDLVRLRLYRPLENDPRMKVISLSGQEPFTIYMKASMVVGVMLASPFIFYFMWQFVAAGLYRRERNMVYLYLPLSLGLFFSGAALAFYGAIGYVLDFLFWFNSQMGIQPTPRISDWMTFVLILPLGFGFSFQLPLVMVALERLGILTIESYWSKWRLAVVVICTISMFLTPADPGSMILMAVPLVFLYFGGIMLCKYLPRG